MIRKHAVALCVMFLIIGVAYILGYKVNDKEIQIIARPIIGILPKGSLNKWNELYVYFEIINKTNKKILVSYPKKGNILIKQLKERNGRILTFNKTWPIKRNKFNKDYKIEVPPLEKKLMEITSLDSSTGEGFVSLQFESFVFEEPNIKVGHVDNSVGILFHTFDPVTRKVERIGD